MSGSCVVITNNNILSYWLSLCEFKVSILRLNAHTKTRAPLTAALIQFVPSCQDKQFVDVLDPPLPHGAKW